MADLEAAHLRVDAEVAPPAGSALGREVDDREEHGVVVRFEGPDQGREVFRRCEGAIREVRPVATLGIERICVVEVVRVAGGFEWLEAAEAAGHFRAWRAWTGRPIGERFADGLAEEVGVGGVGSREGWHGGILAQRPPIAETYSAIGTPTRPAAVRRGPSTVARGKPSRIASSR